MASTEPTRLGSEAGVARPTKSELALVLLACVAVLFYRRPDAFLYPQFYCEDGSIYFPIMRREGLLALIRFPDTPYLHGFNYLVAGLAHLLTDRYAPHIYSFFSLAAALSVPCYLYSARLRLSHRPLLALALVLTPCTGNMVFMNLNYVQWYGAALVLLLAMADDASNWRQTSFDILVLTLIGLTGPFLAILFPLLLCRLWARRSRASAVVVGVALALVAVQGFFLCFTKWNRPPSALDNPFNVLDPNWLGFFGNGLAGTLMAGGRVLDLPGNSALLTVFTILLYVGVVTHAIVRRDQVRLMFLAGGAALLLAAACSWKGNPGAVPPGGHYHFVTLTSLLWALVLTLRCERWVAVPAAILLAWCAGVSLLTSRTANVPDFHWKDEYVLLDSPGQVTLPILPPGQLIQLNNPVSAHSKAREEFLLRGSLERAWTDGDTTRRINLQFETPRYASGLRVRYRAEGPKPNGAEVPAEITWTDSIARRTSGGRFSMALVADGEEHLHTFVTAGVVGAINFKLDSRVERLVLYEIVCLY